MNNTAMDKKEEQKDKKDETPSIFLTTAINYCNGPPHIGHAYEICAADTIARWHRSHGRKVDFVTGADEHGQKIAQTAKMNQMTEKSLCDQNVALFQKMND